MDHKSPNIPVGEKKELKFRSREIKYPFFTGTIKSVSDRWQGAKALVFDPGNETAANFLVCTLSFTAIATG